jgi:hypothetical protein
MRERFLGSMIRVAIPAAAAGAVILVPITRTQAQAPLSSATAPAPTLKTPWGEPDLQGIWTDETDTPLQRPAKYSNQEFFTETQREEIDRERSALLARDTRAERGTERDVNGSYNSVFLSVKRIGARTSKIVDPPNGRLPSPTPEAQKAAAADRDFHLALTGGLPEFGTAFGGSFRRIVQTPGGIAIFYDVGQGQGWQRNVVMNGSPHLPDSVRQWYGDSRGHWEGNSLVVDVTNFSPKTDFRGARENLHLVERWTRTAPNTLEYEVTVEDPTVWTRPWTVKEDFNRQSDEENRVYYEPRCIEGNMGLPGMLHGRRMEEPPLRRDVVLIRQPGTTWRRVVLCLEEIR